MKKFVVNNEVLGFWVYIHANKDILMVEPYGEQYIIDDNVLKATVLSNSEKLSKKDKKLLRNLQYTPEEIAADSWRDEFGLPFSWEKDDVDLASKITAPEKKKPKAAAPAKQYQHSVTYQNSYGLYGFNLRMPQTLAFKADGCEFYGASEYTVDETKVDGVVALTPQPRTKNIKVKGTGVFKSLRYEVKHTNPNTLHMPVPDMDIPPYSTEFIEKVYNTITSTCKSVVVYCSGGKGRTGTVLACFALLANQIEWGRDGVAEPLKTGNDVITRLRRYYSEDAIETYKQKVFVVDLAKKLGYPVTPVPMPIGKQSNNSYYGFY